MKPIWILLALAGTAHADDPAKGAQPSEPKDMVAPKPKTCPQTGGVLFEVDHLTDAPKSKTPTLVAAVKIWNSGAWQQLEYKDGKSSVAGGGCVEKSRITTIKTKLESVKWKVQHAQITCKAYSPDSTRFKWGTRTLITTRTCGADSLDEASNKALDDIKTLMPTGSMISKECLENPLAKGCS